MRLASTPELTGTPGWEIHDDYIDFTQNYSARIVEENSSEPMMLLRAQYELRLYTEGGPYSEEFAEEYSTRQLHMMVRPYFRELVANMTPRALLTVPPIASQFVTPREIIEFPAPQPEAKGVAAPKLPKALKKATPKAEKE